MSDFNGTLKITLSKGHKVLDSANANYSYGSLQRILKFALRRVHLPEVRNVLLLGLGGGSVVATLREDFAFSSPITAVELDPVVIRLAEEEFGIVATDTLRIVCADALDFVRTDTGQYDLIIVDLFIDTTVPASFLAAPFWLAVHQRTAPGGQVLFNTIAASTPLDGVRATLHRLGFAVEKLTEIEGTNTLLLARRPATATSPGAGD